MSFFGKGNNSIVHDTYFLLLGVFCVKQIWSLSCFSSWSCPSSCYVCLLEGHDVCCGQLLICHPKKYLN